MQSSARTHNAVVLVYHYRVEALPPEALPVDMSDGWSVSLRSEGGRQLLTRRLQVWSEQPRAEQPKQVDDRRGEVDWHCARGKVVGVVDAKWL